MIAIINYDTGNLRSVANAIERLGAEYIITSKADKITAADRVILPGVGEASSAMERLRNYQLVEQIRSLTQPVLGICIGMQLMCAHSEENDTECIGIFNNQVLKLRGDDLNVPHMGWNSIQNLSTSLLEGVDEESYLYYVHSYAPTVNSNTIATTTYGSEFSAAINHKNFFGTQFHPEKSADIGERILANFLKL